MPVFERRPPRPSATLMITRDGDEGVEVLLGKRSDSMPSFPGYWAFPGGGVSRIDKEASESLGISIQHCAIMREVVESKFDDSYLIEMYVETTEGLAGEQELINKFGLEIREETTFMLSKRRWNDAVDSYHTMIKEGRPNEGDIIYYPLMNKFFEISFVEDQEPFFQLGNLPVYKLRARTWEYSSEKLDTGITDIDSAEDQYSLDQLAHQFM